MAFNITEVKGELKLGGARPALFELTLHSPIVGLDRARFFARATSVPSFDIGTIQVPYYGRKIKVAGDRVYNAWQTTIMNDEDYDIRTQLESWHHEMNNFEQNVTQLLNPNDYKGEAEIIQYGKDGLEIRKYRLAGLWPSDISAMELDWNTTDTIQEFQVTWNFDYFTVEGTTVQGDLTS
jgi:hypothetical protein